MLQWVYLEGTDLGEETCTSAAAGGHLAVLQWAQAQGCHWDESTCAAATRNGHLVVLRWARDHGCPWDSSTCVAAASGGHLAVLQFADQNGCFWAWDARVCSAAAGGGHLSVLKWLRQHGGEWDSCTSRQAIINNHLELLRWARLQQPPCPYYHASNDLHRYKIAPRMLVYPSKEPVLMHVSHLTGVCVAKKQMVCALLSLRAALPDRTPHEVVLTIMRLAFP